MSDLVIDGKIVTTANAWRFVRARRPSARVSRETSSGWQRASYSKVSDPSGGDAWCNATGATAGEA